MWIKLFDQLLGFLQKKVSFAVRVAGNYFNFDSIQIVGFKFMKMQLIDSFFRTCPRL